MRYFTADLHLAHPRLAAARGYSTVRAHDAAVMSALYELNPDRDELWALGDLSSSSPASVESALEQLSTLRLPMRLVLGNHDGAHPANRNAEGYFDEYAIVFEKVFESAEVEIGDQRVMLSHFPYAGIPDRFSRRSFDAWQLPDRGEWLIHGHTHSSQRRSGPRSICASLEAWNLRPATAEEIAAEMRL